jgi:hypothetical protein
VTSSDVVHVAVLPSQGALEHFYVDQLAMLQEQLAVEHSSREIRERAQAQASARLQLEAKQHQAVVLRTFKDRLDHMVTVNFDTCHVR